MVEKTDIPLSEASLYMKRALELAVLGSGAVSPNPLVGCVIVHENTIIGEGWHRQYGQAHAEVNAVQLVQHKALLRESTVYVTLEPCSHFGKTPPCADMLIREQVKKVIICNTDPFPQVNGKGIEKLQNAGIAVETGLLAAEGRAMNRRFFTFVEKQRPYLILKWAETADGFMAPDPVPEGGFAISNGLSRTLVHKMRTEEDAILVGTSTALSDNPQLNARHWHGRNPVRVLLDRNLRLPAHLHLFDGSQPTLCYNLIKNEERANLSFIKIADNQQFISEVVNDLYTRRIQSVLVEGGRQVLEAFMTAGLWDEILVFKSEKIFGKGIPAPQAPGRLAGITPVGTDKLFRFLPVAKAEQP